MVVYFRITVVGFGELEVVNSESFFLRYIGMELFLKYVK